MQQKRSAIGKAPVVVLVFAVIVVATVAGVYYFGTHTAPGGTPITPTASVMGSSEAGDLQLNVSTNSSLLSPGHSLGITLSLKNIAAQPLNISARGNWTVPGFPIALFEGCVGVEPIEFFVVKGNFSLGSLRQESDNSTLPSIMCAEGGWVNYYLFDPDSSNANLTGAFCTANCHPSTSTSNLISSFAIRGYWAYPINSSESNDVLTTAYPECTVDGTIGGCVTFNYPEVGPNAQHPFTAGVYTLVACDEWNQTVVLHFNVPSAGL